jgi:hypothetical protein
MPNKEDVDEILVTNRFKLEIQGLPSCDDTVRVEVDDVTVEYQQTSQGKEKTWRMYKYGMPLFGQLRAWFRVNDGSGPSALNKDIVQWAKDTTAGAKDKIRKTGSLVYQTREGQEGYRVNFHDLFLVSFDPGTYSAEDTDSNLSCLTCQIGRIDLA